MSQAPSTKGKLYLIPNVLGGDTTETIPNYVLPIVWRINHFVVENLKQARRYLVKLGIKQQGKQIDDLTFYHLNKHENEQNFRNFLNPALQGKDMGLLSDAGCPSIADPGHLIVKMAHEKGITVVPIVGPVSIIMALMASGMSGQQFSFVGYLPIKQPQRSKRIKQLETMALKHNQAQIFMETPYRNNALLQDVLANCQAQTRLCIACDISLPTEFIITKSVQAWKKATLPNIHKRPAVFVIGC